MVEVKKCWVYFADADSAEMTVSEGEVYLFGISESRPDLRVCRWFFPEEDFWQVFVDESEISYAGHNSLMLYLYERDDQKAKDLFIEHFRTMLQCEREEAKHASEKTIVLQEAIKNLKSVQLN